MFQCISITKFKPEKLDEMTTATKKLADKTRQEEGNIYYKILQSADDPNTLAVIEDWETPENFQAHVANADQEGDAVHEYGKLVDQCCETPSILLPCKLVY